MERLFDLLKNGLLAPNDDGAGSEEEFDEYDGPEIPFKGFGPTDEEDDEYEIIDGTPQNEEEQENPLDKVSKDELFNKLMEDEKQIEALRLRLENNEALHSGLASLGSKIDQTIGRQSQQTPQQPQIDPDELKRKINEGLLEDPTSALDMYFTAKLQPEIRKLSTNNLYLSRRDLERDPTRADTYKQFKDEIEEEMNSNVPANVKLFDPAIYVKVHDQVISRHMQEVIDQRVKEAVAQTKPADQPAPQTRVPPHSEGSGYVPPKQVNRAGSIKVPANIAAEAKRQGLNPATYFKTLKRLGKV